MRKLLKLDARNEAGRNMVAADIARLGLSAYLWGQAEAWARDPDLDEHCGAGYNAALAEAAEKLEQAAQAAKE